MVVALVANENWYKYMMVEVYSLLETTKDVKTIYLFTETDNEKDIPYLTEMKKRYKNVDIKVMNSHKYIEENLNEYSANRNSYFTNFCMVKLMLSNILKEDKVLYIDTDAIVIKDISNIWKYNIDDYYVAGIKDFGILKRGMDEVLPLADKYINSGVVVFNLKKMREDHVQEQLFDLLNTKELRYPDQDALNMICHDKTYLLPVFYNQCDDVSIDLVDKTKTRIVHYAGSKDEFWVTNRYYSEEWYEIEERFHNDFGW